MSDSNCPFCDTSVYKFALQCDMCHYWVHYSCTNLPPYAIIQLSKSTRLFSCLTCVHERFKNDFPELHTQIEGAIKSQNDALHLPVMAEIAVTPIEAAPPTTSTPTPVTPTPTHAASIPSSTPEISSPTPTISPPSPTPSASSHMPTHPTIYKPSSAETPPANKPVDNYSARQSVRPAEVTPICKFYMRGHCQYGKQGHACAFAHPPMCYKFLRNGTSSCTKGSNCNYTHPKMCRASLATGNCMRRNCHYYHKSGINRPIMKAENKLNPSHRASYSNRETPLMDLNLPTHNHPQTTTASIKPLTQHLAASQHWPSYISHSYQAPAAPQPPSCPIPQQSPNTTSTKSTAVFLEQMNALKQLMTEMHQAQNQLIMTMSQVWPLITPQ